MIKKNVRHESLSGTEVAPSGLALCMAGSGRSGTSLVASFLHQSGIVMGSDMRSATRSNRLGYFEDLEFLDFHKEIMCRNGVDRYTPWRELDVNENDCQLARELAQKRSEQHQYWGWKDPRATMFMDFWGPIIPGVRFLVMYRDPSEVMTSMYREQRRLIRYRHPTYAPRTWIINNLQALNFSRRHPGSVAFLDLATIKENPQLVVLELGEWLGKELSVDVWHRVYQPSELRAATDHRLREPVTKNLVRFSKSYYGAEMREIYRLLRSSSLGNGGDEGHKAVQNISSPTVNLKSR
jgi:hypothetical protein